MEKIQISTDSYEIAKLRERQAILKIEKTQYYKDVNIYSFIKYTWIKIFADFSEIFIM